jgi:hypothetical protein
MRVIDARSGKEMRIGDVVTYGEGEKLRLLDIDEGLLSANAVVENTYLDIRTNKLVTQRSQIPLTVRFMHPGFLFQRVAFIPS